MPEAPPRPQVSAAWTGQSGVYPIHLQPLTGREVLATCDAALLPGARLCIDVWTDRRSRTASLDVEVIACQPGGCYQLRIHNTAHPRWLARLLNQRRAYRIHSSPSDPIQARLAVAQHRWRGSLLEASQEGLSIRCGVSLEVISQCPPDGTITLSLPDGSCTLPIQLRHLQGDPRWCRVGMSLVDDGTLAYRQARSQLNTYVMQRQREELLKRTLC